MSLQLNNQFIVADWIDNFYCFSTSLNVESRTTVDRGGRQA